MLWLINYNSVSEGGSGQKRRAAMLSQEEGDRRFVCFICKEILPSATLLESHIQAQHAKKTDNQEAAIPSLVWFYVLQSVNRMSCIGENRKLYKKFLYTEKVKDKNRNSTLNRKVLRRETEKVVISSRTLTTV